ncbi:MAG: sigma-70 family RNA polymerase sigma factor [Phycisphaerae bacterium]|jgi:RNA polymerase sigma-70 factor (ECF subfamily)|nr:sigma-70 family RNA polymerase sigma factor [Phycisphaerae bacterium]
MNLTPTDSELLCSAAHGQGHAFSACIDRFGPLVWTLARQMLADRGDAEDAVQEIFAELWRVADRFDPAIASARSFVATIARRRLIDRGRVRQRMNRDAQGTLPEEVGGFGATPLERLARDERARTAMQEFGRLRSEQQKVIRLAVHEDWTHERIAEHLAMPVGTVKTHLRRGLLQLRDRLTARGVEGDGSDSPMDSSGEGLS